MRERFWGIFLGAGCGLLLGVALQVAARPPEMREAPLPALGEEAYHGRFATSQICALCHSSSAAATAMRDSKGRSVAPHDLWRATMMANSARDPFWRAQVSIEQAALPMVANEISAKCLRCHAPMASYELRQKGEVATMELLRRDDELGQIAIDGVSCTLCHQVRPEGLGEVGSFTAGFKIGDEKIIYGPHAEPAGGPMRRFSGYSPESAGHFQDSALCGSCHTLLSHGRDKEGKETGEVHLEQSPYLEWRQSAFNDEGAEPGPKARSCQGCHMPTVDEDGNEISTMLAHNPGGRDFPFLNPRRPYGRHLFVGGNTMVPALLRDNADHLKPLASKEDFDAVIAATRRQLETKTASLALGPTRREEGSPDILRFALRIENASGHKLPTAYPSRRVWLQLSVLNKKTGAKVFEVGGFDSEGRIVDAAGAPLKSELRGGPVAPHRDLVQSAEDVLIYETVMADDLGMPTILLSRAGRALKDNRLLPEGWGSTGDARLNPIGGAERDPNFEGGADLLQFALKLPKDGGPYRIEARLRYQVLGARHLAEIRAYKTPAVLDFLDMLARTPQKTETLAALGSDVE